ncbi:nitroreductase family protein [Pelagibius sp.]|uniref:nitroreductase family protein n=1 Tax=Pelagibius sp. TaxID=1931238 RepID=UPI003B507598
MDRSQGLDALQSALAARFSDAESLRIDDPLTGLESLAKIASRGSVRHFKPEPVDPALLRLLAAVALSAPTKSDLQQRDLVVVTEKDLRAKLGRLIDDQAWTAGVPSLLVFCGNNRRQRQIHDWRGHAFANDHLDAFFNAAVDAGIALATFVVAAEALGLGTCPISALRNDAEQVSDLLGLPDHVFPVAGLAVGWPAEAAPISPRLPLSVTLHENRFDEDGVREAVTAYDPSRRYAAQRFVEDFGEDTAYGWSEDKTRQYAKPERTGFGAFIRGKGFRLD